MSELARESLLRAIAIIASDDFVSSLDPLIQEEYGPDAHICGIRATKKSYWQCWVTRIGRKDYYKPFTEQGRKELIEMRVQHGLSVERVEK